MSAPIKPTPTKPTKAVFATLVALAGSLAVAAADGHVTLAEWLIAAGTALTAGGGVFGLTNAPKG